MKAPRDATTTQAKAQAKTQNTLNSNEGQRSPRHQTAKQLPPSTEYTGKIQVASEPLKCLDPSPWKIDFFTQPPPPAPSLFKTKFIIGPNSAPNISAKAERTPAGTTQLS